MITAFSVRTHLDTVIDEFTQNTSSLSNEQKQLADQTKIALEKFAKQIESIAKEIDTL